MVKLDKQLVEELERLQTQLAGCGVAALGGTKNPAKRGDFGWSQSYQDVLDLRKKYDALSQAKDQGAREALKLLEAERPIARGVEATITDEKSLGRGFLRGYDLAIAHLTRKAGKR